MVCGETMNITMKRIALISNGPSAHLFDARREYDLVVAAGLKPAGMFDSDWWVMCDWQTFTRCIPKGIPKLFIPVRMLLQMRIHLEGFEHGSRIANTWLHPGLYMYHEDVELPPLPPAPNNVGWCAWSGTAAMVLMHHLKPRELHTYGVDLFGEVDCSGTQDAPNRTEDRWKVEREVFSILQESLERQFGTIVTRFTEVTCPSPVLQ